jgi:hypothetical protein
MRTPNATALTVPALQVFARVGAKSFSLWGEKNVREFNMEPVPNWKKSPDQSSNELKNNRNYLLVNTHKMLLGVSDICALLTSPDLCCLCHLLGKSPLVVWLRVHPVGSDRDTCKGQVTWCKKGTILCCLLARDFTKLDIATGHTCLSNVCTKVTWPFLLRRLNAWLQDSKFYLPIVKKVISSLEVTFPRHFLRQYSPERLIDFHKEHEEKWTHWQTCCLWLDLDAFGTWAFRRHDCYLAHPAFPIGCMKH